MPQDAPRSLLVRRLVVSLVLVVAALAVGGVAQRRLADQKKDAQRAVGAPPLPVVRVEAVERRDFREVLRGYGTARALRRATVSAEVAGLVRHVADSLRAGATVAPPPPDAPRSGPGAPEPLIAIDVADLDDVFARLTAERTQLRAEQARADREVEALEAQLEVSARRLRTARLELERIESLVPDTLSASDADRQRLAVFALEQLQSELSQRHGLARAGVEVIEARFGVLGVNEAMARRDIERTAVHAPFAGQVVRRHVDLGALVAPGTPLFEVVDPTLVEVAIALPASRYGQVEPGTPDAPGSVVTLRLSEDGPIVWRGHVVRIDPSLDPQQRSFGAYVEIHAPDGRPAVAPGSHVVADVEGALHRDVLPVPREAFIDDVVYVSVAGSGDEPPRARERRPRVRLWLAGVALVEPPEAGSESESDLRAGDLVVVSNLEDLGEGSNIRPLEMPEASAGSDR